MPLQGLALPADAWERDVLPRRVGAYSPTWMDQLCAGGEIVWIGAGALGRSSGRVALYFREDLAELGPPQLRGATAGSTDLPEHAAVRERLAAGACFFTDLLVDVELAPEELQEALWDLAWAGEATNDAFAPLRAPRLTLARAQRDRARATSPQRGPLRARRRGGAAAQVQGRWSLTAPLFAAAVDPAARRRALAELLLERYGVLTREQVLAEGIAGGFSAIYSELSQLETLGDRSPRLLRRGARRRAVCAARRRRAAARAALRRRGAGRARGGRPGAALRRGAAVARPWRRRGIAAARASGRRIRGAVGRRADPVPRAGRARAADAGAGGRRAARAGARGARGPVRAGAIKRLALEKVDGEPAMASALGPTLVALGFQEGPRRLTLTA